MTNDFSITAIILAAGKGERFKSKASKALLKLRSVPLILYSLTECIRCPSIKDVVITVNNRNKGAVERLVKRQRYKKRVSCVLGGARRQDSVRRALKVVPAAAEAVIIHDAARPFIDNRMLTEVCSSLKKHEAVITAVPVKATIKKVVSRVSSVARKRYGKQGRLIGTVKETLDRSTLWEVQTPQGFRRDVIIEAHRRFGRVRATDDAMLVERMGTRVAVVMGSYGNIKITTPEDLAIARALEETGRLTL